MQRFSQRLIALRKERDITQTDLANAMGKKRSTISGYETEGKEPDFDTLCSLTEFFGVTIDYLLGRDNERTPAGVVFRNDNVNFKKHYDALPPELKPVVTELFDDFYVLLNRDMQNARTKHIVLYRDLLHKLKTARNDIKRLVVGNTNDILAILPQLLNLENSLKNEMAAVLDKLLESDLEGQQ